MAKNKNRKQSGPPNRAPHDEKTREQAQHEMAEEHEPSGARIPGSPTEVARKQQKRFGHN
ncbi:hypothetical protein [Streptomyces sp. YIM S03343]